MKTEFTESFARDLKKIKDKALLRRIKETIEQVEQATNPQAVSHLKHLAGGDHYYRIRLGDYRLGLLMRDDIIVFVRRLNRKEIYRVFPLINLRKFKTTFSPAKSSHQRSAEFEVGSRAHVARRRRESGRGGRRMN